MKPVLIDTGCIVALLDRSERHHGQCADLLRELGRPLISCEAVIAEACYLLRGVYGASAAVLKNVEKGIIQIPFRLPDSARPVATLMKQYEDLPMDLADACLVSLAADVGSGSILTLNRDFSVYRWGRNRPFELLIDLA